MHLEPTDVIYVVAAGVFALFTLTSTADLATKALALVVSAGVAAHALRIDPVAFGRSGSSSSSSSSGAFGGRNGHNGRGARAGAVSDRPDIQIDGELYTLRARKGTRHLALRRGGELLRRVSRAAALGGAHGNSASGARATTALEDFFMRYHWALLKSDEALSKGVVMHRGPDTNGLISRTLSTLRDTRIVAMNSLQEISFTVPLSMAGPVRRAVALARSETLACLEVLATRLARADPVAAQVASVAWRGPTPHDPLLGRPSSQLH